MTDEELFDSWKELFTKYRSIGYLPDDERKEFIKLSNEMRKRGLIGEKKIK